MADAPKHLVRTRELDPADGHLIRHPLNPDAEARVQPLGEAAGMQRVIVSLARVPPGRESFLAHAHLLQEEFLFVLEGTGTARIGDAEVAVGPGDFMGFPTDGTPHTLRNTGTSDLVYLMGGERTPVEAVRFPTLGKVALFSVAQGGARIFDEAGAERLSFTDWVAKE